MLNNPGNLKTIEMVNIDQNILGIYTRVKKFLPWIKKNARDGHCDSSNIEKTEKETELNTPTEPKKPIRPAKRMKNFRARKRKQARKKKNKKKKGRRRRG